MTENKKIENYDRYIREGGDMTLEQIETLVKQSLDVTDTPLKSEAFDDFMSIIIEGLNDRKKMKNSND